MNRTTDIVAKATIELYSHLEKQVQEIARLRRTVRTPQRRANYKDSSRFRRADLKNAAFADYGCTSTFQIKEYLQFLNIRLDLRLTSAWVAIRFELRHEILAAKAILDTLQPQPGQILATAFREAIVLHNWHPAKVALLKGGEYKNEAWKMLNTREKQQLSALVPEPVKLLTKAKRSGAIARFEEDPEGDIYWVWRSNDANPELVTSCFAKTFVRNLAASSISSAA